MGNDVPLKSRVFSIIEKHSPEAASTFNHSFFHPERTSANPTLEISDMNRFWRRELAVLDIDTLPVREALIDDVPVNDWLRHFESDVVPFIAKNWPSGD